MCLSPLRLRASSGCSAHLQLRRHAQHAFLVLSQLGAKTVSDDDIATLFQRLDTDASGTIEFEELNVYLRAGGEEEDPHDAARVAKDRQRAAESARSAEQREKLRSGQRDLELAAMVRLKLKASSYGTTGQEWEARRTSRHAAAKRLDA